MKKITGLLAMAVAMFIMSSTPASAADRNAWFDATHSFQPQVEKLVKKVKLETRKEHARRHRAPEPTPKQYKVGDVETFWTKNIAENKFEQTRAVLKAIGVHCYVFVEEGKTVADAAVAKVQTSFDTTIYPTDTSAFGSEWKPGVDGDERITLLMFDIKDGYDPNGNAGYVGGYFFAGDEFLQSQIPADVPVKSNEREMFYLDINPADPTQDRYMSIVAHEFQHMIHFIHDPRERSWVNECCSQIAPYLCGFGHAGQIKSYMQSPDNSLTAWSQESPVANYGQVYLWGYYLMNRYLKSDADRRAFFNTLVADEAQGIAGFDKALKQFGTDFRSSFTEFMVANFINDPKLDKGQYAYDESLNKLRLPAAGTISALPAEIKDKVFLWSADTYKADLSKLNKALTVEFAGPAADFGDKKTNSFVVAAVLSNSRDAAAPKIEFMKLAPYNEGKILAGSLAVPADEAFDTLNVIVLAQAPEGLADAAYAKVPGLPYILKVTDQGAAAPAVARGRRTVRATELIAAYTTAAESLNDPKAAEQACITLEGLTADLTSAAAAQLEAGDTTIVDEFISRAADSQSRAALRPLAARLADQLRFAASQNSSEALTSRIETLKNF
ncbi:MAG TPA: hypothetical protein PLU72_11475 [Candidatus Ozemobacteraceae bacterium]|nr:hypothetical protein [Candidatus Ozemobacteraceae bacterium]